METKPRSLFVHSLIYGLILGAALVVISLIYYILDINMFGIGFMLLNLLVTLAVVIVVMLLGVNAYRDRYLGGKIDYKRCFFSGLIIGLVGFIISTLYSYIFMAWIEPGMMEENINQFIEKWGDKMTEDQLDTAISKMQKMTPASQIQRGAISGLIMAVILSLLISLFVKKDKTGSEVI
ncbi:MAG: DUF4199 domain-containing protein [Bacteroidales bacterium]|nr:DUF4199 domain-containing protein [Lentimicrobiaceae bacterium]MDD5695341.1 DUF4199 domain-containing protein [Bacteroidales bacterium]